MKTIDEATHEYINNFPPTFYNDIIMKKRAFKAGVEFAQQWHSIKEELPPEISTDKKDTNGNGFSQYTSYIVKGYFDNKGKPEAVKIAWFRPCVTKWDFRFYKKEYEPKFIITHWRPINIE